MKINTALIVCAGFGKRLNPLTLDTPKPLIELNNVSVLETCINLIESLDVKEIFINTFYLKDQIRNFINKKNFKLKISIIEDGKNILDTGGGIKNMLNHTKDDDVLIFNPDTIIDKASYETPKLHADGIENVFVNGEVVWAEDSPTTNRPGMFLPGKKFN